jgi:nucleotide-binding universal stress UspA family protein
MIPSLRQVLVHLDATRAATYRLEAARRIAQQHGAALAALYAVTPRFLELPYAPELGPTFAAELVRIDEERRASTLKAFEETMRAPGPVATWSQANEFPIIGSVARQALYADLLVLGQHDRADEASTAVPPDFVESVLLGSGRPAVVIPYVGWSGEIGMSVAVAWKETPEAARAVTAAMPILKKASRVHVLTWGYETEPLFGGHVLGLEAYLRLHGVTATWHQGGPEPDAIGELLLSRACDVGADLLVMGCYGHSRAREWILGGATRTILQSMTLPVLMAH